MSETIHVPLTTDIWTLMNCESYMAVTSYHLDNNWSMSALSLKTFCFPQNHMALNISQALESDTIAWGINAK
jgi:hypothetical protein